MSPSLNAYGEIVNVNEADQFQPARSQFECGFFAAAITRSMAQPGHAPTLSTAQIIADAENWYAQYNGDNGIHNTDGMSNQQLYDLLHQIGLHYQATETSIEIVKKWIRAGYPVIIGVAETSIRDMHLGDSNPYPWTPRGNHIILVTGVTADGNVLVRDSANCTNLYDPGSLRPGPRTYDASKIMLVSATVAVPPWMPRPTSAEPPPPAPTQPAGVPHGWSDDGTTLTAPNGHKVVRGFRKYVLENHWDAANQPLEEEQERNPVEDSNPALGQGAQQVFNWTILEYTQQRGVFVAWGGQELLKVRAQRDGLRAIARAISAQARTIGDSANSILGEAQKA